MLKRIQIKRIKTFLEDKLWTKEFFLQIEFHLWIAAEAKITIHNKFRCNREEGNKLRIKMDPTLIGVLIIKI